MSERALLSAGKTTHQTIRMRRPGRLEALRPRGARHRTLRAQRDGRVPERDDETRIARDAGAAPTDEPRFRYQHHARAATVVLAGRSLRAYRRAGRLRAGRVVHREGPERGAGGAARSGRLRRTVRLHIRRGRPCAERRTRGWHSGGRRSGKADA